MDKKRLQRLPLMLTGIITLLIAIYGGLQRMAWDLPVISTVIPLAHGQLMVGGFLGTVITLERAVVIKKFWSFLGPIFTGIGSLVIILDIHSTSGAVLITLGSLILIMMFIQFIRTHPALHTGVMTLAAAMWFVGNVFWLLGFSMANVLMWWMGFLVLTILGERLELSRKAATCGLGARPAFSRYGNTRSLLHQLFEKVGSVGR